MCVCRRERERERGRWDERYSPKPYNVGGIKMEKGDKVEKGSGGTVG